MNFILSLLGGSSVQIYIYLAVLFAGFSGGFYVEHLRFVDFQDGVKIVAEKQIAENKAKEKEQELINRGVTDAYNANLSNVHNFYHGMLNDTIAVQCPPMAQPPSQLMAKPITFYLLPSNAPTRQPN